MESRVLSVEKVVGRPIECGGMFKVVRNGFAPADGGIGGFGLVGLVVGLVQVAVISMRYRHRHRHQPKWPLYVVLALTDDTIFVFAAAIAAGAIGREIGRFPLAVVSADLLGSTALQLHIAAPVMSFALDDATIDHESYLTMQRLSESAVPDSN